MKTILILVAVLIVGLTACSDNEKTVCVTVVQAGPLSGNILRLEVKSEKYYFEKKNKEIRQQLETVINSGKYNIRTVRTVYISGSLVSAQVLYDLNSGVGNNLRVIFVQSDAYYFERQADEVKLALDEVLNNNHDIVDVKIIDVMDKIVAAEVYYRIK